MEKCNVLGISYGRHLFDEQNVERQRMETCASAVDSYHMIVFTRRSEGYQVTKGKSGLTIHPTNSRNKLTMIFDAMRIGSTILKDSGTRFVVTSQDPFESGLVGYWLSSRFKVRFNVQEHGDFFSTPYWRRDTVLNRLRFVLGKFILRRATSVRVVSDRIGKTMRSIGVPAENIIKLPVRSDQPTTDSVSPYDYGFADDTIVILTMARLVRQKNLPLLLKAFKAIQVSNPNTRLVIIGSGSEEQNLKTLTSALQLDEQVVFLSWTNSPAAHYKAADIFALSSDWEGWARTLVEAMSYQLPIITTDVGCAGEVVVNDRHGYVVPIRDEKEFTDKLQQLVTNSELRQSFAAQAAKDSRTQEITAEEYAKRWAVVLKKT